jgi:hypothetical protein
MNKPINKEYFTPLEWINNRSEDLNQACESLKSNDAGSLSTSLILTHQQKFVLGCKCGVRHQLLYMVESPCRHVLTLLDAGKDDEKTTIPLREDHSVEISSILDSFSHNAKSAGTDASEKTL